SLPSAFTPTSAPLTPFPRHPRLPRHSHPPEISIYVLPPTKRRARVGQPSFCAGCAAQKLLIRYAATSSESRILQRRSRREPARILSDRKPSGHQETKTNASNKGSPEVSSYLETCRVQVALVIITPWISPPQHAPCAY